MRTGETRANTARLTNLSARVAVGGVAGTPIPGFFLRGPGDKPMLIRAVGPTLGSLGVTGALADPTMTLFRGAAALAANDNWPVAANSAEIAATARAVGAFALPEGSCDAAILASLPAGAYTVVVSGVGETSGTALVELYVVP